MNAQDRKNELLTYLAAYAGDLPPPDAAEYLFAAPARRWRGDFVWFGVGQVKGVLVEMDGGSWAPHGGRHNGDADKGKCNRAAALGWLVLHITPQMLETDATAVCADLRLALQVVGRI